MAFAASGLTLLVNTVGGGPRIWNYESTDAHTDVDAADYFAKMGAGTASDTTTKGMKVGDIVFVHDTDAPTLTMHRVTAISAAGHATVSAATLA